MKDPCGSKHYASKLDEEKAREIYQGSRKDGKVIAHKYGVSESTVRNIWIGRTWKHATGQNV